MSATTEVMLMMRPERAFSIERLTARVHRNTPVRLRSITLFQSEVFIRISRPSLVMPALLTRTSRRPDFSSTVLTMSSTWSSSATLA